MGDGAKIIGAMGIAAVAGTGVHALSTVSHIYNLNTVSHVAQIASRRGRGSDRQGSGARCRNIDGSRGCLAGQLTLVVLVDGHIQRGDIRR